MLYIILFYIICLILKKLSKVKYKFSLMLYVLVLSKKPFRSQRDGTLGFTWLSKIQKYGSEFCSKT
jgi:hypothetical protein